MAETTVAIDIRDMRVPITNPINIVVINQPNPVTGCVVNGDELEALLQFPRYMITESGTSKIIDVETFYDYFPDRRPSGSVLIQKEIVDNGEYEAKHDNADGYSKVTVNVEGGGSGAIAGLAKITCYGYGEVTPYGVKVNGE